MHRIAHTTAFVTPVVEYWLEREIAQWVHPMKDRSDDPSHHERTLLPWSYISHPLDAWVDELKNKGNKNGLCYTSRGALAGTRNSWSPLVHLEQLVQSWQLAAFYREDGGEQYGHLVMVSQHIVGLNVDSSWLVPVYWYIHWNLVSVEWWLPNRCVINLWGGGGGGHAPHSHHGAPHLTFDCAQ